MKRYSLLLLPLVAVVFGVSCRDTTSPAGSHALLSPRNPDPAEIGNKPPPPVDAAITIEISSDIHLFGAFNGVYFANGSTVESATAAAAVGDQSLTFDGTAWLRLDNTQPLTGTSTSANARFQTVNGKLSGHGTLVIQGHVVVITEVTSFALNPECGIPGDPCAFVTFKATVDNETGHTGSAQAFDRSTCDLITPGEGDPYYDCEGSS
jgi:hypothetical protein